MHTSIKYLFCIVAVSASIVQAEITIDGNVTSIPPSSTPSSWDKYTDAYIGKNLDGSLTVNNGDKITTSQGILGSDGGAKGTVTISDSDSTWDSNDLVVGNGGIGELNILNGGNVCSTNTLSLGESVGSNGTITISGSGSLLDSYGIIVGQTGIGNLNIAENGMVVVRSTQNTSVNTQSSINMSAGGMLALPGERDDSLATFLDPIDNDNPNPIRWWNPTINDWDSLTTATLNTDYTLDYLTFGPFYGYTRLTVHSEVTTDIPGDANRDGVVDSSDATILAGNWQAGPNASWEMGDFNGDGIVNSLDATILAGNWQISTNSNTVPEPGILYLLFGLLALGFLRRFK